ncbi:DNA adenine methylase [Pseudomonas sp. UBA7530]|uniref:DNA adenine methylase n=1 Tax=Pseudomonas sp. UBA7530 TaxID=1947341 RepID=UPI0025E63F51|nr:DNA adenine methylase [Pseudomonas sp. UBA7530]
MFKTDSRGSHEGPHGDALSLRGESNASASLITGTDFPCLDIRKTKIALNSAVNHDKGYLPLTRYYGSKRRLVDWMVGEFQKYEFQTALDVFGGTSTVSLALKNLGKQVTYNDILESNRVTATALLSNQPCLTSQDDLEDFFSKIIPEHGFVSEYFNGIYYTSEENNWLDGAINELSKIKNTLRKCEILYCLMQACLQKRPFNLFHRKNLHLRQNNTRDTKFGNWATWEKPFSVLIHRALGEIIKARQPAKYDPIILPCTDAIALPSGYDFVYLDPPYIPLRKQDISYMDRYHFLEGLCNPSQWKDKIDLAKINRPIPCPEDMSKWISKVQFKDHLFTLIEKHKGSTVCLSYVHDAYPGVQEIKSFFSTTFRHTVLLEHDVPHALSKKTKKEIILIGRS